jgi:hypothetical protein
MAKNEIVAPTEPSKDEDKEVVVEKESTNEESTQAEDQETGGTVTEENEADQETDTTVDDSQNDDDPKPDDDEPVWNMKQLRSTKREIIKVKAENKELKEKLEKAESNSPSSEADTLKIAELQTLVKQYEDEKAEIAKTSALREAGLPESYLALLEGEEENWRKKLDILASENKSTPSSRLKDDQISNGVSSKYKGGPLDPSDRKKVTRQLMNRR